MDTYDALIRSAATRHLTGSDWRLLKAQIQQESQFDPVAVSPAGAAGLAQFMPKTWLEWAPRARYPGASRENPQASVNTGACYMAYLLRQWYSPRPEMDRYCLALASYNAGLGSLLKAQREAGGALLYADIVHCLPQVTGENAKETVTYVYRILSYYRDYVTGGRGEI